MNKISRKEFIQRFGILGMGALSATALLQACGGESTKAPKKEEPKLQSGPQKKPSQMTSGDDAPTVDCSEYNKDLTEQDMATRNALKYQERSNMPGKDCVGCRFWQPEKFEGDCGGCQLFANGAVNPKGYCTSWAAPLEG